MASTANDRLTAIYSAYKAAFAHRAADLREAATADEVQRIMANVDALEASYLDAARQSLDASGADIEACYQAAKAAADEVTRAYQQGRALADRIRAVSGAVTAAGNLLTTAAKLA